MCKIGVKGINYLIETGLWPEKIIEGFLLFVVFKGLKEERSLKDYCHVSLKDSWMSGVYICWG